MEEET
jgi:hypothetical protein